MDKEKSDPGLKLNKDSEIQDTEVNRDARSNTYSCVDSRRSSTDSSKSTPRRVKIVSSFFQ